MKFSSTIPLALALAAGVATAAAAQTTTPGASSPTTPQAIAPTTPAGSKLGQQGYSDNATTPAGQTNAIEAQAKPKGQLKASHTRTRRMAQTRRAREPVPRPTAAQVRTAQLQLHAAGLYNGPTDGMMDPDTRAALARFQQQNGLRRTETLDPQTLAQLNSSQTTGYGSSVPSTTPAPKGAEGNTAAPTGAGGTTQNKSIKPY